MARRVVSVIRDASGAPHPSEPVLEANAYAVAESLDLSLLLRERGIELALMPHEAPPPSLAGARLPDPAAASDLRGLLESGVPVFVDGAGLAALGLERGDLHGGVEVLDAPAVADLLRRADAVIAW